MVAWLTRIAARAGLTRATLVALVAVGAAVLTTLGLLAWDNSRLRSQIVTASADLATLRAGFDVQTETISALETANTEFESAFARFQSTLDALADADFAAGDELRRLKDADARGAIDDSVGGLTGLFELSEQATSGGQDFERRGAASGVETGGPGP